jgi:hypothetical protein
MNIAWQTTHPFVGNAALSVDDGMEWDIDHVAGVHAAGSVQHDSCGKNRKGLVSTRPKEPGAKAPSSLPQAGAEPVGRSDGIAFHGRRHFTASYHGGIFDPST